jgi:hypothetical protein
LIDIDEVTYSEKLETELVRGSNRGPIGWTAGIYTPGEASISMGKSTFQSSIVEGIGDGWLGSIVQFLVKHADVGEPVITDKLVAKITGVEDSKTYGAAALKSKVSLQPMIIERNGIKPIRQR